MALAISPMSTGDSTTVFETTNGSFQNQAAEPPAPAHYRKRGISGLLQDITNTGEQKRTRRSAVRAKSAMESQTYAFAPHGNPQCGGKCGGNMRQARPVSEFVVHESEQLQDNSLITDIHESLGVYIQRNVSYEIQKARALHIMVRAVQKWCYSIMKAADCASDCFGFNPEVIRRWASAYVEAAAFYNTDEVDDDECISEILMSNKGQKSSHAESLLHDENFCLAARTYIRSHSCQKGEPNLTGKMKNVS